MSVGWVEAVYLYQSETLDERWDRLAESVTASDRFELVSEPSKAVRTELVRYTLNRTDGRWPDGERWAITASIPDDRFARDTGGNYVDDAIDLFRALYEMTDPQYVYGTHVRLMEGVETGVDEPVTESGLAAHRINHPTWLMIFPPAMVDTYGREWLLDLPANRIEELDDGAILTVAVDDFEDCDRPMDVLGAMENAMEPLEAAFAER